MKILIGFLLPVLLVLLSLGGCSDYEHAVVGTLERNRLALRAPVSEPILKWHVSEGEAVTAGQLLVSLDASVAETRLAAAQAQLAQAQARLDELIRGPRKERILQARAAVDEAQAQFNQAKDEFQRVESLVKRALLPQAQLDKAIATKKTAAARLQAAKAELAAQLEGTTTEQLDQARAAVAVAQAQLQQAQIARQRLNIHAPVAGVVEALPFRVGERPPANAPVAILLAAKPVYARVYIPTALRTRLQPGDAAKIHLSGTDKTVPGEIRYLASEAAYTPYFALTEYDRGNLSYLAEIDVTGEAQNLPTGLPITVTFPELSSGNTDE